MRGGRHLDSVLHDIRGCASLPSYVSQLFVSFLQNGRGMAVSKVPPFHPIPLSRVSGSARQRLSCTAFTFLITFSLGLFFLLRSSLVAVLRCRSVHPPVCFLIYSLYRILSGVFMRMLWRLIFYPVSFCILLFVLILSSSNFFLFRMLFALFCSFARTACSRIVVNRVEESEAGTSGLSGRT